MIPNDHQLIREFATQDDTIVQGDISTITLTIVHGSPDALLELNVYLGTDPEGGAGGLENLGQFLPLPYIFFSKDSFTGDQLHQLIRDLFHNSTGDNARNNSILSRGYSLIRVVRDQREREDLYEGIIADSSDEMVYSRPIQLAERESFERFLAGYEERLADIHNEFPDWDAGMLAAAVTWAPPQQQMPENLPENLWQMNRLLRHTLGAPQQHIPAEIRDMADATNADGGGPVIWSE